MKTSHVAIIASLVLACATWLAAADTAKDPSAKLVSSSNWQGTHELKGHASSSSSAARLKVTKREGKMFTGDFYLNNARSGRRGVRVTGEVDSKSGEVHIKPYEIISGAWGSAEDLLEEVWAGSIDDNKLKFQRKTKRGTWDVVLTLKTKGEKDNDE